MNRDASVLLLGDPVSRSLSPDMQNAAFEALRIDCRYLLREVNRAGLAGAMAELRGDERIIGANVTIPHKESVIPYLDDLDAQAARIGAVNTISRQGATLKGWNTDVEGFQRALDEQFPAPARGGGQGGGFSHIVIIGAGGAARAVAAALQPAAEVWVVARDIERARRLCHDLAIVRGGPVEMDYLQEAVAKAQLVVNATPADLPPASWLRTDQVLFDLRSGRSAEGRAMLLHQGAASFEIWTGRKAPLDVMRAALDRASVPA
ncbi:MAG TPA: shikimate dehydrogenase [Candidatus Dormibacteraeota bacterium]|jgi:shikimate dehydrogenase|nr:shikimate dehydrogenase [Candidatus Dormibacteraeota bacterium]